MGSSQATQTQSHYQQNLLVQPGQQLFGDEAAKGRAAHVVPLAVLRSAIRNPGTVQAERRHQFGGADPFEVQFAIQKKTGRAATRTPHLAMSIKVFTP